MGNELKVGNATRLINNQRTNEFQTALNRIKKGDLPYLNVHKQKGLMFSWGFDLSVMALDFTVDLIHYLASHDDIPSELKSSLSSFIRYKIPITTRSETERSKKLTHYEICEGLENSKAIATYLKYADPNTDGCVLDLIADEKGSEMLSHLIEYYFESENFRIAAKILEVLGGKNIKLSYDIPAHRISNFKEKLASAVNEGSFELDSLSGNLANVMKGLFPDTYFEEIEKYDEVTQIRLLYHLGYIDSPQDEATQKSLEVKTAKFWEKIFKDLGKRQGVAHEKNNWDKAVNPAARQELIANRNMVDLLPATLLFEHFKNNIIDLIDYFQDSESRFGPSFWKRFWNFCNDIAEKIDLEQKHAIANALFCYLKKEDQKVKVSDSMPAERSLTKPTPQFEQYVTVDLTGCTRKALGLFTSEQCYTLMILSDTDYKGAFGDLRSYIHMLQDYRLREFRSPQNIVHLFESLPMGDSVERACQELTTLPPEDYNILREKIIKAREKTGRSLPAVAKSSTLSKGERIGFIATFITKPELTKQDALAILGLSVVFDPKDVPKAYKETMMLVHSDRIGQVNEHVTGFFDALAQVVNRAKEILDNKN